MRNAHIFNDDILGNDNNDYGYCQRRPMPMYNINKKPQLIRSSDVRVFNNNIGFAIVTYTSDNDDR